MFSVSSLKYFTFLRSAFLILVFLFFDYFIGFNENNLSVLIAIFSGATLTGLLLKMRLNFLALALLCFLLIILPALTFYLIQLPFYDDQLLFKFYAHYEHARFLFIIAAITLLTSYMAMKFRAYFQLEFLAIQILIISLLSGHRNYHFDMVKKISDLAWQFNVSPFLIIIAGSAAVILIFIAYLYSANAAELIYGNISRIKSKARFNFSSTALIIFFSLIVILLARIVYYYHFTLIDTRITNGVGATSKEGLSPLDFHSALGSSNQPTAIVRLNGDYTENPLSPMLYIRESALSSIDGNQLVLAENKYDIDISRSAITENFSRDPIDDYGERKELDISVYTLNDHKLSFAIDYPVKITPLKLSREQQKFKAAYHALSLVPVFSMEDLRGATLGDTEWSTETLKHYTEPHKDERYHQKALEITKNYSDNLSRVIAISKYLSQVSTYTLQPDHKIKDGEDPTAPYLFGDLRGYCVHFAHATVYMLRSLGIPARIGTGYLTDLSQSKDGHILLRMSDRHAWPEVYLDSFGWIPFDITPEKVESSAESPVDQTVLDELIDLLGTDEELLSDDLIKEEFKEEKNSVQKLIPYLKYALIIIPVLAALLYLLKLYQYFFWIFCRSEKARYKYIYLAIVSLLYDAGFTRLDGETKESFLQRVSSTFNINHKDFAPKMNALIYSSENQSAAPQICRSLFASFSRSQKLKAVILPRAAYKGIGLWRW